VRQRLRRTRVDESVIDGVVVQLQAHRLLDDRAFAEYWVEQRQTFRPRGARLLRAELARLGVARGGAEAATAPLEESAEEDAYRAAARQAQRLRDRDLDEATFRTRLGQWLARRGFDWDVITPVVGRLCQEREL
jgi:regulatory protein